MPVEDINRIPDIMANLAPLEALEGVVGIVGSDAALAVGDINMARLAAVHEFGMEINVTDKMRKYLAVTGLHLKASTTTITIPERSFLREGLDRARAKIETALTAAFPSLLSGSITAKEFLNIAVFIGLDEVQGILTDPNEPKPNLHPYTIDQKGSAGILENKGNLAQATTGQVRART